MAIVVARLGVGLSYVMGKVTWRSFANLAWPWYEKVLVLWHSVITVTRSSVNLGHPLQINDTLVMVAKWL